MSARTAPLSDITDAISELRQTTRLYGFGSFFDGDRPFNDIDLLAVCACDSDANSLRATLGELLDSWPIHLTIMTAEEEAETNFVSAQRCCRLFPVAAHSATLRNSINR